MKYYIGIDLGGTNIVAGVVDENYNIIAKSSTKTNLPRPEKEIAADMAKVSIQAVKEAGLDMSQIEWVGIGTPGIANSEKGIIEYSCNLGFDNTPMVDYIKEYIDKPVFIENDANAAAYGEYVAGAAKGARNAVCITLGTGVGGGIVIDGKIYSGSNFAGAEIGHMVIEVDGPQCTCGRKGCFEVFSSATGLIRMTKEAMAEDKETVMHKITAERNGKVTARTSFDAMRMGDKTAKAVVDKFIRYLAAGITNTINIFQPDILCIGGGVCNEGDPLLLPVK
ncbi:MAG: ROK family protein, partial [Porcipelethomonas sp.]